MSPTLMSELLTIPGLDQAAAELLEAAGFHDLKDLSDVNDRDLVRELERANRILKISKAVPSHDEVAAWVRHAREQTGIMVKDSVLDLVDYERDAKVLAMLGTSPLAIPLPGNALKEKGLSVPDIPSGLLLNAYPGNLDIRVDIRFPKLRADSPGHSPSIHISENFSPTKLEIDISRLKSVADLGPTRPRVHASPAEKIDDRVALIRAPRASTNEGRDPNSRRFIRGVLHTHPLGLYAGAILTLLLTVVTPVALVATLLLLFSREKPEMFDWVDARWLAFPIALPVIALAWAFWGFSGRCRVCSQKLFMHRPHRKHIKAHHVRGLGYVLPLCIHMLCYHWFRCSHCGTPVRLKK
jgi:Domain of unknown function (DUF4332)